MASLQTLPPELHLVILTHLDFLSTLLFRSTCHQFSSLIPYPTQPEMIAFEQTEQDRAKKLFCCNACHRLRRHDKFDAAQRAAPKPIIGVDIHEPTMQNGKPASERFCVDCGTRDLTGNEEEDRWKYAAGKQWIASDGERMRARWGRCKRCRKCRGDMKFDVNWSLRRRMEIYRSAMKGVCQLCEGNEVLATLECTLVARMAFQEQPCV